MQKIRIWGLSFQILFLTNLISASSCDPYQKDERARVETLLAVQYDNNIQIFERNFVPIVLKLYS